MKRTTIILLVTLFMINTSLIAQGIENRENSSQLSKSEQEFVSKLKTFSKEHVSKFKLLKIRTQDGEVVTVESFSDEIFKKVLQTKIAKELDTSSLLLGMIIKPKYYQSLPLIYVDNPNINRKLLTDKKKKYFSFNDFFNQNREYILADDLTNAIKTTPSKRTAYDKELILVDDTIALNFSIYDGSLLKIFPNPIDSKKWESPQVAIESFPKNVSEMVRMLMIRLFQGASDIESGKSAQKFNEAVELIGLYQTKYTK